MKRVILLAIIVALAIAFCSGVFPHTTELVSTVTERLSPAVEKVKELLPGSENAEDQVDMPEEAEGWSLRSLGDRLQTKSQLQSTDDVALVPTDDYAQGYVFEYDGQEFIAYFDTYSWRVYDSYKITNHDDIVIICQALLNEHSVYGSDWASLRTAEDMAFEWEQHNLAYYLLPEDSSWREDAKDVDLDPDDQGKTFPEMYESRGGSARSAS